MNVKLGRAQARRFVEGVSSSSRKGSRRPLQAMAFSAIALVLGACAVGPDYRQPSAPVAASFGAGNAAYDSAAPEPLFWTQFDDPQLSRLIEQASRANHDLRIALANLNQARALRHEARLDYLPAISAEAGYSRSLQSRDQAPGLDREQRESDLYTGGFDAAWELDFFGRVRRANESASATEQALLAQLRDAQISVAAEVARSYFELRGTQERYAVAQRNADNQRETLRYAQLRLDAGSGTEFDVARAQAQLSTTRAVLPQLDAAVENGIHRLSVLSGLPPTALQEPLRPVAALPELPRLVHIGKPEDLLRRRADVRAVERLLAADTAQIGVAVADWFPRVSFRGELGFAVQDADDVGSSVGETWGYGPGITWAAFDLSRVAARVERARAKRDGSVAAYEQTVLRALEETENALVNYGRSRQQLDHLQDSVTASDRAAALARARFDGGASDFLDVLDAERAQLAAQDRYAQARIAAATGLVALYKALGGGWDADGDQALAAAMPTP